MDNDVSQKIVRTEQVFILPSDYALKFGAWFGPRSDNRTETIFHAGVSLPVNEGFRLEPTVFYSRSGLNVEREVRGLLAGEYRFRNDIRLGGGFAGGRGYSNNAFSTTQ